MEIAIVAEAVKAVQVIFTFAKDNNIFTLIIIIILVFYTNPRLKKMIGGLIPDFRKSTSIDTKVAQIFKSIKDTYGASSVFILQFHNGGKNMLLQSFSKVTCTHCISVYDEDVSMLDIQQMPSSILWNMRVAILNRRVFGVLDVKELVEYDFGLYSLMRQMDMTSLYGYGLYTIEDQPFGFVGVLFRDKTDLVEDDYEDLKLKATAISAIFCAENGNLGDVDAIHFNAGRKKRK